MLTYGRKPSETRIVNRSIIDVNCSRMVKQYVDFLAKCHKPEILDVGPACGNNISFFLGYVAKLHVSDLLGRNAAEKKQDIDPEKALSYLAFKEKSLDGINIWDLPDHVGNRALSAIVRKLCCLLKPNGMLVMIASTTSKIQPYPLYFAIRDPNAVILQNVTTREMPYFYRSNRDMEKSMHPFRQANSFICTNGIREFLFRL
jgi:hypothetical protein